MSKPMNQREEGIGEAIFTAIFKQSKELGVSDLLVLRSTFTQGRTWGQLPEPLRRRFTQVGVDLLNKLHTIR